MLTTMGISAWKEEEAQADAPGAARAVSRHRGPAAAGADAGRAAQVLLRAHLHVFATGIGRCQEEAEVTTIASQAQIPFAGTEGDTGLGSDLSEGVPWGEEGGGDLVIQEEELPSPDEFVPYEDQPVLVERPAPVYPELAQMAKIEGTVIVKVLVGKDGKVKDAIIGKGVNGILDQAALDAAKNAVFRPAMQNKKPVAVWVAIPFKFQLY
jgi:protein TonB